MPKFRKRFSWCSLCLATILMFSGTSSTTVYATHHSDTEQTVFVDSKKEEAEQLIETNLKTGEKKIIDLPSVASFSETEGNTFSSPGLSPFNVYDEDNRTVISNTTASPYYGIAYLNVSFTNGSTYRGTAFMISPNVMLTAGHNLYEAGYEVTDITAYPGRSGDYIPQRATATTFYLDTKYTGTQSDWDYGIIVLDQAIGNTTGWFGLHAQSNTGSIGTSKITVTGYPSDLAGRKMWRDIGSVSNVTSYRFKHNADTYKGNSGSPSYAYNSSYGHQVYGIHTHGGNYSRRITMSLFDWLKSNGFIR